MGIAVNTQGVTQQMVFKSAIELAQSEMTIAKVIQMFDGDLPPQIIVTLSHRHAMAHRIFSSTKVDNATLDRVMAILEAHGASEMLSETKKYCQAARPTLESKAKAWENLFDAKSEMSLKEVWSLCAGFRQPLHSDLIAPFASDFFTCIPAIADSKPNTVAKVYFKKLMPNLVPDDDTIAKFR